MWNSKSTATTEVCIAPGDGTEDLISLVQQNAMDWIRDLWKKRNIVRRFGRDIHENYDHWWCS